MMGNTYVTSDEERNALHEIRNAYNESHGLSAGRYVSDEEVERWAAEKVEDAHDDALDLLKKAVLTLEDVSKATKTLGGLADSYDVIKKVITGARDQLRTQRVDFRLLDTKNAANEDKVRKTAAYSTYNESHITLRRGFYEQNTNGRAHTVVHEVFHIISPHIVHEKDNDGWNHNAYTWDHLVGQLAGEGESSSSSSKEKESSSNSNKSSSNSNKESSSNSNKESSSTKSKSSDHVFHHHPGSHSKTIGLGVGKAIEKPSHKMHSGNRARTHSGGSGGGHSGGHGRHSGGRGGGHGKY